jgi:hypothetical protein
MESMTGRRGRLSPGCQAWTYINLVSDPPSKSTISGIIDKLPRYGADGSSTDSYGEQKRDLTALTGELQKALASGTIKDPDGKIASSLAAVDTAEKAAVTSYSGSHDGGYDRNGGVSIYLPDSTFRDIDKTLAQDTPLSQAAEVLDRFAHLPTPTEGPDQIRDGSVTASSAQQYVGSYLQKLDAHQKEEAAPLVEAMDQLGRAGSPQERQAALHHASDVAHQMLQSKLQQELVASADHMAADKLRQQKLDREMDGELPGWKGFVQALEWRG